MKIIALPIKTILIIFIAILFGCAKPIIVKQEVTLPAKIDGLKASKKIAFLKFEGDSSGIYTHKIEQFFRNLKVDDKPYFEIIERQALENIIKEQKLSQSGLIKDADAIKAGNISGADTLVIGSVQEPKISEAKTSQSRTDYSRCLWYKKTKKNKLYCVEYAKYRVDCFNTSVAFQYNIKFINIETAKSNYSNNYGGSEKNAYCEDRGEPSDTNQMSDRAFNQAILKMRQDVAPYKIMVSIELLDEDDGSELDDQENALKIFSKALKMIKNGNIEVGCNNMQKASAKYNQSPAIFYNLGVCAEIKANWDRALRFYKAAQNNIVDEPLPLIPRAINRVKKRTSQQEKIKQQSRS